MSTMDLEIAAGYGECSVCFEPLCTKGASVMVDGSGQQAGFLRPERLPKRVCRHFLCQEVRRRAANGCREIDQESGRRALLNYRTC